MNEKEFLIRRFQPDDREAWTTLWRDYIGDSEATAVETSVLESNWDAILRDDRLHAFALCSKATGQVTGFAHYVFHYSTKSIYRDCYLIDLYIAPNYRKRGGGKYILDRLMQECREKKLFRLTWIAQKHNIEAQKFYDKIATGSEFIRYKVMNKQSLS